MISLSEHLNQRQHNTTTVALLSSTFLFPYIFSPLNFVILPRNFNAVEFEISSTLVFTLRHEHTLSTWSPPCFQIFLTSFRSLLFEFFNMRNRALSTEGNENEETTEFAICIRMHVFQSVIYIFSVYSIAKLDNRYFCNFNFFPDWIIESVEFFVAFHLRIWNCRCRRLKFKNRMCAWGSSSFTRWILSYSQRDFWFLQFFLIRRQIWICS